MKIKMLVELEYDEKSLYGNDKEGVDWFFNDILKDNVLTLHSNELGDSVGEIKILSFINEEALNENN